MKYFILPILYLIFSCNLMGQDLPYNSQSEKQSQLVGIYNTFKNIQESLNATKYKSKSDTLWLFTVQEIYQWEDDHYMLKFHGLYRYGNEIGNPGYGETKEYIGLDPVSNDSVYRYIMGYDINNRNNEVIFQNYDSINNGWENFSFTEIHFDQYGHDSCTLFNSWDKSNSEWIKNERQVKYRNEQEAIVFDVFESWTGTAWYRHTGQKFDYFNNGFACTDSIHIFEWRTNINDWFMKHKWFLHYDENNVQTWGRDMVFDEQLQTWRNYQQTLDYEFNNWCSCEDYWKCTSNPTHFILQNWYDNTWVNVERYNAEYDTLGGEESIFEGFDGENWYFWRKTEKVYFENGQFSYLKQYDWLNGQWIQIDGYKHEYTFVNDTLIEMFNKKWDQVLMDWENYFLYKYKNYIPLQEVNSIFENQINNEDKIKLIPNPSDGYLKIEINPQFGSIQEIDVYDNNGTQIFTVLKIDSNTNYVNIDISKLADGIYLISVKTSSKEIVTTKLIKK